MLLGQVQLLLQKQWSSSMGVFQMALAEPDSWRHEKLPWPKAYRDLQMYERTATPQVSG